MRFNLFMYCTVGRRAELEAGMAGQRPELYRRMLDEIAEYARFADEAGYSGFGHPEHHLQIEGFEISNDPRLTAPRKPGRIRHGGRLNAFLRCVERSRLRFDAARPAWNEQPGLVEFSS